MTIAAASPASGLAMTIVTSSLTSSLYLSTPPAIFSQRLSEGSLLRKPTNLGLAGSFQNPAMPASLLAHKVGLQASTMSFSHYLQGPSWTQCSFIQSANTESTYSVPGSEGPQGLHRQSSLTPPDNLGHWSPSLIALGKLEPCSCHTLEILWVRFQTTAIKQVLQLSRSFLVS